LGTLVLAAKSSRRALTPVKVSSDNVAGGTNRWWACHPAFCFSS